jgi:EAL domain-containing protein (putative c-di-GMP-specific phosphodiesterase class I)
VTPQNRVLLVLGGAAMIAAVSIALTFGQTDAARVRLQADQQAALALQTLGDQLVAEVQDQREALNEYLLAGTPGSLARFRQAVADEAATASQFHAGSSDLTGVTDALAGVARENETWRATIAGPAIAAVESGSPAAIQAAIQAVIQDRESTEVATSAFVLQVDVAAAGAGLGVRSDALDRLRDAATVIGISIELVVACLSLWFVRRYGLTVSRDSRRRAEASAERIEIVASLRTLRTQGTPEATAATIAEALRRLPGVDVAAVFEFTSDGLLALAVAAPPTFPIQTGGILPKGSAEYLRDRSTAGPWAELWTRPTVPTPVDDLYAALGMKSRAFAPVLADGELVGLIALATSDEHHARRLVEDLPAVGEFASVAETVLAPALVARRQRAAKRLRIGATIASEAFRAVFQPVVDLATGNTVGFEALTRFDDGCPPDRTFAAAVECGMGIELETVTLGAALREARLLPPRAWLSLNVSPTLLAQGDTLVGLLAGRPGPVVLEVTEHEAIDTYAPLRAAMLRLGPGVRLAVDDAGAGVANFNHLVGLRPDFVKIDAGLVRGVDADPSRRAVVVGLIHFAAEAGCQVIAEGIETAAERATVAELGVTLGQGYLLARPAPAGTWSGTAEEPAACLPSTDAVAARPIQRQAGGTSRPAIATPAIRPVWAG